MSRQLEVPVLTDGELVLRPWRLADLPTVRLAARDPYIPLITTVPRDANEAQCQAFIERQWRRTRSGAGYSFAICLGDGNAPAVGQIGLFPMPDDPERATTGYWLLETARGSRAATRALTRLTTWALADLAMQRLELTVEPWNKPSIRTAQQAGYEEEGLLRSHQKIGTTRKDMIIFAKLPEHSQ